MPKILSNSVENPQKWNNEIVDEKSSRWNRRRLLRYARSHRGWGRVRGDETGCNIGAIPAEYIGNVYTTASWNDTANRSYNSHGRKKGESRDRFAVPTMEHRVVDGTILVESRFFSRLMIRRHVAMQAEIGNFDPSIARFVEL